MFYWPYRPGRYLKNFLFLSSKRRGYRIFHFLDFLTILTFLCFRDFVVNEHLVFKLVSEQFLGQL